jgi:hypothetical protein
MAHKIWKDENWENEWLHATKEHERAKSVNLKTQPQSSFSPFTFLLHVVRTEVIALIPTQAQQLLNSH